MTQTVSLIGAPVDCGKRGQGCRMGPDAYRVAGLGRVLSDLGHPLRDLGNVMPDPCNIATPPHLHALGETIGWTRALSRAAQAAAQDSVPLFLGGDHALSAGTVHGLAAHWAQQSRPFFVLWLDAHADYHTPKTTQSGNLHGTPLAYVTGSPGFDGFPPVPHPVTQDHVCILGLRSVDPTEKTRLSDTVIRRYDMRDIDEHGIASPLRSFLSQVKSVGGALHVSLDVDFLDPGFAPAVGTTVPGGATLRESHLVMELIHDAGVLTSMDLVELNPMLDERGRTAQVMVDLTASAFGRTVFDRPTHSVSELAA